MSMRAAGVVSGKKERTRDERVGSWILLVDRYLDG
jgi:hypothetical protein